MLRHVGTEAAVGGLWILSWLICIVLISRGIECDEDGELFTFNRTTMRHEVLQIMMTKHQVLQCRDHHGLTSEGQDTKPSKIKSQCATSKVKGQGINLQNQNRRACQKIHELMLEYSSGNNNARSTWESARNSLSVTDDAKWTMMNTKNISSITIKLE